MLIPFKQLIRKHDLKITGAVHCGASDGQERDLYNETIPGKVIWVEAIPNVYQRLSQNIRSYTKQSAYNICVSDKDNEEVVFNVSSNDGQSSSLLEFGIHTQLHPTVSFIDKIKLTTTRLDTFFFKRADLIEGVNYLHLDLQGAELMALKGLGVFIDQFDYIILEVNQKETYKGCALVGDIDCFLSDYKRVETGQWVGGTWTDALYIKKSLLPAPLPKFIYVDPLPYPQGNIPDFEYFFFDKYTPELNLSDREYIPVTFTSYYKIANFGKDERRMKMLQEYLDSLDRSKKYFAIVQYDDAILSDLSGLDVLIFAMSPNLPDQIPLPLICQPKPFNFGLVYRDIKYSFVGSDTHPIRKEVFKIQPAEGQKYYITDQKHAPQQYCSVLARSVFGLCPRGYGPNSFRIQECMEFGAIPVVISDDYREPYGIPFEQYGIRVKEKDVHEVPSILSKISVAEIESKREAIKKMLSLYSFEGCFNAILHRLNHGTDNNPFG